MLYDVNGRSSILSHRYEAVSSAAVCIIKFFTKDTNSTNVDLTLKREAACFSKILIVVFHSFA
jgi:hypothetical protein